jgi:hypothetical protein
MNVSINNRTMRTLVAAAALGLAFAGGVVTGRSADATPRREASVAPANVERMAVPQYVYYVVDSRQAALDAERAEYVTAQERVLAGIVAPERIVHLIDASEAAWVTGREQVMVATGK